MSWIAQAILWAIPIGLLLWVLLVIGRARAMYDIDKKDLK
jgi:hypothetical protein